MYVPAPSKPLLRRITRRIAWAAGETAVSLISRLSDFRLPNEALQPYAISLPMLTGTYESNTVKLMKELVRPGMTVIDGGAHVGYFTRLLSKLVGRSGRVIAFEIHPETFRLLGYNVRQLENVEICRAALGPNDGNATIYESPGLSSGNSTVATKPGLIEMMEVPMRSIKSVLSERGLAKADFIKLDIEGGEPAVIRSLELERVKIIFEVKRYILEAGGVTPEHLLAEMIGAGFNLTRIGAGPIVGDGLNRRSAEYDKCNVLACR